MYGVTLFVRGRMYAMLMIVALVRVVLMSPSADLSACSRQRCRSERFAQRGCCSLIALVVCVAFSVTSPLACWSASSRQRCRSEWGCLRSTAALCVVLGWVMLVAITCLLRLLHQQAGVRLQRSNGFPCAAQRHLLRVVHVLRLQLSCNLAWCRCDAILEFCDMQTSATFLGF